MKKYKVSEPRKLKSWKAIAKKEIERWLIDDEYKQEICDTTLTQESLGPFTKFLYHFASQCQAGWGVLIDFDEKKQRVFLPNHYYQWMHELRDEVRNEIEIAENKAR